jgi:predicted transcriptional regulator
MKKSKLEQYEDILNSLADKPSTIDTIAYSCNMDCMLLQGRIDFLIKNDLVEKRIYPKKAVYALTRRGITIQKSLTVTKRLEKLKATVQKIERSVQAIPEIPEYNIKNNKLK